MRTAAGGGFTAPTEGATPEPEGPVKILKPAAVPDWRGSSWDLLNGVEITDETDSIPGELFDSLFRP